jgi:hypothetical protein
MDVYVSMDRIEDYKNKVNEELQKIELEDEFIDNEMALQCINYGYSVKDAVDEICRVVEMMNWF